jgi:hypothetical protein
VRGLAKNTIELIRFARQLLEQSHPMNLRQLFYAIFKKQYLPAGFQERVQRTQILFKFFVTKNRSADNVVKRPALKVFRQVVYFDNAHIG